MGRAPRSIVTEMLAPAQGDVHVWVFEGKGHLHKRRQLYDGYKNRPSTATTGFFAMIDLIREALGSTKAIQVDVPTYEADDIIAHLACQHVSEKIKIHTTDRDLNQLLVLPNVTSTAKSMDAVNPKFVRLYKTYVGDTSDRIPGLRGFGDQSWLLCDKEKLLIAHLGASQGLYVEAGLSPRLAARAVQEREQLDRFWRIVGFLELEDDLGKYLRPGICDPHRADAILKQFNH